MLRPLPIRLVPLDAGSSCEAGMLCPTTREGGLPLGDRCCLALARPEGPLALTAERRWPLIAEAAGFTVALIR